MKGSGASAWYEARVDAVEDWRELDGRGDEERHGHSEERHGGEGA